MAHKGQTSSNGATTNRFAKRWSLGIWHRNPIIEVMKFKVHYVGASASPA